MQTVKAQLLFTKIIHNNILIKSQTVFYEKDSLKQIF